MLISSLKALLKTMPLLLVAACYQADEQVIFSNDQVVPLPEKVIFIYYDEKTGETGLQEELSPLMKRVSPNQFEAEGEVVSFEKLNPNSSYWIMQVPQDGGNFDLVLVQVLADRIMTFLPLLQPSLETGALQSRDEIFAYFEELARLQTPKLIEFPVFFFDATLPDPEGKRLREKTAEAKNATTIFLETLYGLQEDDRLEKKEAREAEEQRERKEAERKERERLARQQQERNRLLQQQNEIAKDKEQRVISFSDGTELSFCISESTIEASTKAANEQNYFVYINRLDSLNNERLCTRRLSMGNIEEMTAAVEYLEKDDDTGRVFMIGSIARNYFTNCPPCDNLRPSDRLYFVVFNDVGGEQYGWKGLEQFIVNNRTVGGIMDFFLSE